MTVFFVPFTHPPLTLNLLALLGAILAKTVLFSGFPLAVVLTAVWPEKGSSAFFFPVDVVSHVLSPIFPGKSSLPVPYIVLPLTSINLTTYVDIRPCPMDLIIVIFTLICTPICKPRDTLTLLQPPLKVSLILSTIRPDLLALPVL